MKYMSQKEQKQLKYSVTYLPKRFVPIFSPRNTLTVGQFACLMAKNENLFLLKLGQNQHYVTGIYNQRTKQPLLYPPRQRKMIKHEVLSYFSFCLDIATLGPECDQKRDKSGHNS